MRKIILCALLALTGLYAAPKEGLLLGLDWNLSAGSGESIATDTIIVGNAGFYPPIYTSYFATSSLSSALKLSLGFQRYSQRNPALGFNIKAKLGVGLAQMANKMTKEVIATGDVLPSLGESVATSYLPLTLGIEGNFLYDFLERGEHTLGLSLGLGVELMHAMGAQHRFTHAGGTLAEYVGVFDASGLNHVLISPKVGLHYYYGRHQFGLDVSFDKTLDKNFISMRKNFPNSSAQTQQTLALDLGGLWSVGLGYAYRF